MEALFAIVGALASKAAEYTVDPAARQLSYLFKHKSKFLNLRNKVQELKDAKERVQQSVDLANRNGEDIFDDVKRWLTEVNEKASEQAATRLQEEEEKAMKGCFAGIFPDFNSRYRLSKKADKETDAIVNLLNKKDGFGTISYRPAIEAIDIIGPVKEYEAFGSRSGALDGVMESLEDNAVSIIGVYGMGGVGKTTLVREVARRAKEELSFDEVVFVAVTQTPNNVHLQNEIANKLGLKLAEDPSIDVRAARLRDRLKKADKVLFILDDIWEEQEVDTLGIPSADQHKGCKILLTSRTLVVLKSMGSQKNLPIDLLKEDEAWNLFKNVAGHIAERSDLQSTAKKVAKKCAGLPVAITTVAKALKHKENLYEWKDALEQLKPSEINFKGISAEAYSAIEMSYKYLKREELKYTFLLCSIMGHDAAIQDLLKHSRGLGLFHGLDTMEKVRNRVLALVSELKDSSLLLAGSNPEHFDMHDVVRDVAISIASRDHGWLALGKEDVFEEWSDEDILRNCNLVSFHYAKVSELPDELNCPNLNLFSMHSTDSALKIPSNFFSGMQRLKVLNFSDMNLLSLPSSVGSLKTLCTLRLLSCDLKDIAILGELVSLEILDLSRSKITMLPKEIGKLTRLKLLDLRNCVHLKVISPNVLPKLSRLEELYLYDSFDKWDVEGIENPRNNASLVELQYLSRLNTLEVHIPDVETIPNDNLFLKNMERYKISIGDDAWNWYDVEGMETSRMLKLKVNKSIHLTDVIKLFLENVQSLYLDGLKDIGEMDYDKSVKSVGQLRFMKVKNCCMLKNLFSLFIAKRLHQLEELEVFNCENITELIVEKEEISENDIMEFNKLRILKLDRLYRFNGSWYSKNTLQSSTWLFDKKVSCPALEELYLEFVGGIEKIWHIDDGPPVNPFHGQCLTCLTVSNCPKLKYVFTSSMVKSFVHLKTLMVSDSDEIEWVMEGILAVTEEEISSSISVFPKLDSLRLHHLPKLKGFCSGINPIEFLSLRRLEIWGCDILKTFFFDNGNSGVAVPHYLFNEKVSCPALEVLEVNTCQELKYVFTSSLVKDFVQLKTLIVSECDAIQEIVEGILEGGGERISGNIRVFPKLEFLQLLWNPKLNKFCCGTNPIEFPSLKHLTIGACPNLNSFSFDNGKTGVALSHYLFNERVSCPALEALYLGSACHIEKIWHIDDQLPLMSSSVQILTRLEVKGCEKLKYVFTSSMVKSFVQLKTLVVSECYEVQGIIEGISGEEGVSSSARVFPKLDSLKLLCLPKLQGFCCGINPIKFPSLRYLQIQGCSDLNTFIFDNEQRGVALPQYLFNEKVILPVLKELVIYNMDNLERLWSNRLAQDSFSRLTSINLGDCPKLVNVFSSSMLTRLQRLDILRICYCESLEEIMSESQPQEQEQQQQQIVSHCFCNLKVVILELYLDQVSIFPSYLFRLLTLPNLQTLEIRSSCFKEMIFRSEEGGEEKPVSLLLSQITELRLHDLHELRYLWKEREGFPNLRILHVESCSQIKVNLVPSSVSFRNLVTLEVSDCDGIIKLFTHSTAKSLVLVKQMSVRNCLRIEEIIEGGDDDDHCNEIGFPRLNRLELEDLPKLQSFCSSQNYAFGFPSLEIVLLRNCPNMKMFSQGDSNTPMLHKVQLDKWGHEERCEGSLNGTIQQLFRQKCTVAEN